MNEILRSNFSNPTHDIGDYRWTIQLQNWNEPKLGFFISFVIEKPIPDMAGKVLDTFYPMKRHKDFCFCPFMYRNEFLKLLSTGLSDENQIPEYLSFFNKGEIAKLELTM